MNTVTQSETLALSAVAAAAAVSSAAMTGESVTVPEVAPYELHLIPLSRLRPSSRNVRQSGGTAIPELAASIARVGLLQNLTVITSPDEQWFEVVAGRRRLAALKLLVKRHKLAKDHLVPCLLVPDTSARTVSLSENVQREAMTPVDELFAWKALVAEGRSTEDIAADFGVTPLVVKRRLRLANVSPRLLADYQQGAVSLEQLMALAITDDHAAQEAAFYEVPQWQRHPESLRDHLTHDEVDASRDALAHFVGVEAYEAAGGGIRRDLFADEKKGVFLTDAGLLEKLARDRLADAAESVRAEGWGWVEVTPRVSSAELHAFQRARRSRREPTKAEAKRIEKLEAEQARLQDKLDYEDDDLSDDGAQALHEELDRLGDQLDAIEQTLVVYDPGIVAMAGAVVSVGPHGRCGGASRAAARGTGQGAACAGAADTGRTCKRRGGASRSTHQPGRPVREAGEAPERTPHRRLAGRGGPPSPHRPGGPGTPVGAAGDPGWLRCVADQHQRHTAGPSGAACAGSCGGTGCAGPASRARGLGIAIAGGSESPVCRTAGDGARRTAVAAGPVRGPDGVGHRSARERNPRCAAGAGGRAGHAQLVDAHGGRLLRPRIEGEGTGGRPGLRTG